MIAGGLGLVPGDTMQERRLYFEEHRDELRLLLARAVRSLCPAFL